MASDSIHLKRKLPVIASAPRLRKRRRPTPKHPLILSASELRTYLRCRVKWSWRYANRIIPKKTAVPLIFGGLVHNILEVWYGLPRKKRTTRGMEIVSRKILRATKPGELSLDDLELAEAMVIGYAEWAQDEDAKIKPVSIKPELWFDEPLTPDGSIRVRGKIDAAFRVASMKSTIGAFEHKTKSQIRIDVVDMNLQLSVYLWALRRIFPKRRRYIAYYNVLRKQMPGPRVRAPLFARESVERSDEEIQQWETDVGHAALDMLNGAIYPNPMDACSWDCDYQTPCMLRGRPADLEFVLEQSYQHKDGTPYNQGQGKG